MKKLVFITLSLFANILLGMDAPDSWVHSTAASTSDHTHIDQTETTATNAASLDSQATNMPLPNDAGINLYLNTVMQPARPSLPGSSRPSRPRPQAVHYGTAINNTNLPIVNASNDLTPAQPSRPSLPGSSRPSRRRPTAVYGATPLVLDQQNQTPVPAATPAAAPVYGLAPMNPQTPAQPTVTNPMHIITTTQAGPAAVTPQLQTMTVKEQDRLRKIEKDLGKIEDVLKEMGIDLGAAAVSAAFLDPIGAAFSASSSVINIPKLAYFYGNMQKHILFLSSSKTSPAAQARLKQLTPRLQTVSRVIAKGPESLQKLIKKFSKEETKEAK